MKFEIDISDRSSLTKCRNELSHYLKVVEFALAELDASKGRAVSNGAHVPAPIAPDFFETNNTEGKVVAVIERLPKRFSTTDVMIGMGDEAKKNRSAIKFALKRLIDEQMIEILKPGQGRRPTKYGKRSEPQPAAAN
jgi:hypothetical protein